MEFKIGDKISTNDSVNPLFKNSKIMKMKDILTFNNYLFVYDQINEDMPFNFEEFFSTSENQHPYNTRGRKNNTIMKTLPNSTTYVLNSVRHRAVSKWNETTKTINTIDQNNLISKTKFVKSLKEHIFSLCDENSALYMKCRGYHIQKIFS